MVTPSSTMKREEKRREEKREEIKMGNNLRCCLACILPCGALDVIRIVHRNGQVEEYSRQVSAGEILAANPNHVISKLCSREVSHRILIVSPDSDLKRGHIYFLIPSSSVPEKKKKKKKKKYHKKNRHHMKVGTPTTSLEEPGEENSVNDASENKPGNHRRRSSRVATWRPHLERITEDS